MSSLARFPGRFSRWRVRGLGLVQICNRVVGQVGHDQVIQQLDAKDFPGVFQSLCDLMVFIAGGEDSGGMVVGDDDGDGSGEDGSLVDFSWMYDRHVGCADRDDRVADNLMGSIKIQGDTVFATVVGEN